jgi:ATP-binding cassette subfamily B protein
MLAALESDEVAGARDGLRPVVLRRLAALFRPHVRTLALATVLLAATTAAQLAGPLLIRRAIDVDIRGKSIPGLLTTVATYVLVQAVFLFLNYVQKIRLERMGQEIILGLRRRLFSKLLGQPLSFYDRNPVGRLISRVQSDTDALRQMFASTVASLIEALVLFAGMLAVMATVSARLTFVVAGIVPPMIGVAWLLAIGGSRRFREVRRRAADIAAFIAERVQGVSILQAFSQEEASVREMEALNREKFRLSLKAEWFAVGLFQGIFYFEIIGLVLVLWFGGRWAMAGALSLGTLFMFIEYIRRLFEPVMRLSEQLGVMQRAVAAAGRVFTLLDLEPDVRDPAHPVAWEGLERDIEFRDVSFSYGGNDEYALRDVSFRIPRGEKWAIVGATGGGKTSILNLLLRFYDPQQGAILLDGKDARSISQRDLRRRMALVLQDVYLFPGDILSNLAPDGESEGVETEERLRAAARVVGADSFIERLPGGYRTSIAERGGNLSAGERQILSFARALAADPEILLLDEATASVDPRTEAGIQRALKELLTGRTAIVIAHRLSTVRDADGILVVQGGRIVERGRHEDLLDRGGVYADLHALQVQPGSAGNGGAAGSDADASAAASDADASAAGSEGRAAGGGR